MAALSSASKAADAGKLAEAELMMERGFKALNQGGFFNSMFASKSTKFENAVEHFSKAANKFKTIKQFQKAGTAYVEAAKCKVALEDHYDAGTAYSSAAECFQREDVEAAREQWYNAIACFEERGKFNQCGNLHKNIANSYDEDGSTVDLRIDSWERAMDAYLSESPPRTVAANGCREQVALLCVQRRAEGDLAKAATLFQEMAEQALQANLTKYNAKGHMMKACLCILGTEDVVKAQSVVTAYQAQDPSFESSMEEKLILSLIQAMQEVNADAIASASSDYNTSKRMDPWMVSILLALKRDMEPPVPEGNVDDQDLDDAEGDEHDDTEDPDLS